MRHLGGVAAIAVGAVCLEFAAIMPVAAVSAGTTSRVSVTDAGTQSDDDSFWPSINADGSVVAFRSRASNLVVGDTNGFDDVFVRSSSPASTTRVSVATDGTQGNGDSQASALSADGTIVVFDSTASNLVAGDTNGYSDVFVRDLRSGTTTQVSVASDGTKGSSLSTSPAISADGRRVAFASSSPNLVEGDTNGANDIFVRDLRSGTTTRVSVATDGSQSDGASYQPTISADGTVVAFTSPATNLVAGDLNGRYDIFVRDLEPRVTSRVSVASDGTSGAGYSESQSLSTDGKVVVFKSGADDLVPGDTNYADDIFVRDRNKGTTARVSLTSSGGQANSFSGSPSISGDGTLVAFDAYASNLVANDTNGDLDVFVRDLRSGVNTRVSVASDGNEGDGNSALRNSSGPSLGADGSVVAFQSGSTNLVPGDTNETYDIFTHGYPPPPPPPRSGYWMLGSAGAVYGFGDAAAMGSAPQAPGQRATNIAVTPTGNGYLVVNSAGQVNSFGDATNLGGSPFLRTGEIVTSISTHPSGHGYWLFTSHGRVFPYGVARQLGDLAAVRLSGPVLGSVATPSGNGYYMVAADGGIFAFGDAAFRGSMGGQRLNGPVVGLAPDPDGIGYWLVGTDGGIFAFDSPFRGSMGNYRLNGPVIGMVAYGNGYLMVATDGGIFNFSTKPFAGSLGGRPIPAPIVAVAALNR